MDKEKTNFLLPGYPLIIVKKLTKEIIIEAITEYASSNGVYWLKFYHFAGNISDDMLDQFKYKAIEEEKKFE